MGECRLEALKNTNPSNIEAWKSAERAFIDDVRQNNCSLELLQEGQAYLRVLSQPPIANKADHLQIVAGKITRARNIRYGFQIGEKIVGGALALSAFTPLGATTLGIVAVSAGLILFTDGIVASETDRQGGREQGTTATYLSRLFID